MPPSRSLLTSLVLVVLSLAPEASPQPTKPKNEVEWSAVLSKEFEGSQLEYRLPDGSRVDILTRTEAIEVEWSDKWPESIGQSVYYGMATNKQPSVYLLLRNKHDEDYLQCLMVCRKLGITLRTIDTD